MAATGTGVRGVASELWDGHLEATRPSGGSWDVRPAYAPGEVHDNYSRKSVRREKPESDWNAFKDLDLSLGR